MSVRLFEGTDHAQLYAKFRPAYPDTLVEKILRFLSEKIPPEEWKVAVDVGCGTGQGTNRLARYFQQCYGFDVSPAQISEAKESNGFPNVFYEVSPAENLPSIASDSVQLLTGFAAAHWFDWDKFVEESARIVTNNGVVALICYHMPGPDPVDPSAPTDKRLINLMEEAWFDQRLSPYKSDKIKKAESHYNDLEFPSDYECVRIEEIYDSKRVIAKELLGFYQSWSLFQGLKAKDRQMAEQCLNEFSDKLKNILNVEDLSYKELVISYKYFILMWRKLSK